MEILPSKPATTKDCAPDSLVSGQIGIAVGWCSLAVGAAIGMVMGLWSFGGPVSVPHWLGDYSSLSRRLLRLGHIAFFGLGILNILLAQHLAAFALTSRAKRIAAVCINFGNILLPLTLISASVWHPLKYLTAVPATAVFVALAIGAHGALRSQSGRPPQGQAPRSRTTGAGS